MLSIGQHSKSSWSSASRLVLGDDDAHKFERLFGVDAFPALGTNVLEAILNSKLSVGMLGAST